MRLSIIPSRDTWGFLVYHEQTELYLGNKGIWRGKKDQGKYFETRGKAEKAIEVEIDKYNKAMKSGEAPEYPQNKRVDRIGTVDMFEGK